jgi:hypothetical protein
MQMQNDSADNAAGGMPDEKCFRKRKNSGIVRRLWHHWLSGNRTGFHLTLGGIFIGIYALAGLIASSMAYFPWKQSMQAVGFAGLFVTLLLVLLHANLHGSNRFLQMFEQTSHLPVRQLTAVCVFCMILFLTVGAFVMGGCSLLLSVGWTAFCRWLEGRRVYVDPEAAANIMPDMDNRTPDLAALAGEVRETPAWVYMAEQVIFFIGYVMIAAIVLFALWQIVRYLYRRFSRPVQWDDDVRISLKPEENVEKKEMLPGPGKRLRRLYRRMFASADPRENIREQYRRTIRGGLKGQKQPDRKRLRAATPEELEAFASVSNPELHEQYEKARYDE